MTTQPMTSQPVGPRPTNAHPMTPMVLDASIAIGDGRSHERGLGDGLLGDGHDTSRAAMHLYKGGSDQWFVTYELGFDDGEEGSCPQVTRVYLSGQLRGWELGRFTTRSGAIVHGVKIEYERTHERYRGRDEHDERGDGHACCAKIIELPPGATSIEVRSALPDRYRHALHRF